MSLLFCHGADGGTRTHTPFQEADFKSAASTSFATSALKVEARVGIEPAYTALQAAA
jgi:hypothetical protein